MDAISKKGYEFMRDKVLDLSLDMLRIVDIQYLNGKSYLHAYSRLAQYLSHHAELIQREIDSVDEALSYPDND